MSCSLILPYPRLPLLTKLTLLGGAPYLRVSDEYIPERCLKLFLATHGSKIKQLCLSSYFFPVGGIIQACPNVGYVVIGDVRVVLAAMDCVL